MIAKLQAPWMVLAGLLLTSCGGSDPVGPAPSDPCPNLSLDATLTPVPLVSVTGWNVTYSVTATAGAAVSSIQYRNASGTLETVTNPTLPFTYAMSSLPMNTQITLSAVATAPSSSVSISMDAVGITDSGSVSLNYGPATCRQ